MTHDSLTALLTRLREAKGADRELDVDIGRIDPKRTFVVECSTQKVLDAIEYFGPHECEECGRMAEGNSIFAVTVPRYTDSLDQAIALVERVLPSYCWEIRKGGTNIFYAEVWEEPETGTRCVWDAEHLTPPLALLTAMVQALISKESAP